MTHLAAASLRWRGTDHSAIRIAHGRRSEDVLSPDAFSLLERAAHEANRIYGALAAENSPGNSTLARLAPAIYSAADETMAEMLELAAQFERYPENGAQVRAQGQRRIDELKALADQAERLHATVDSSATDAPQVSRIQAVLRELHADAQARVELQQTVTTAETEAPQVQVTSGSM
jgi:chromosome condensin MukBEF ATPase and DNA-binding subunit MukB